MSDFEFWFIMIATTLTFAVVIIGIYAGLRFVENRYYNGVERIRRMFATYSVPIIVILIFGVGYFKDQTSPAGICNAAGQNTVGWTCNLDWFLMFPILPIAISLSAWYWVAYRNKLDPLDSASRM